MIWRSDSQVDQSSKHRLGVNAGGESNASLEPIRTVVRLNRVVVGEPRDESGKIFYPKF